MDDRRKHEPDEPAESEESSDQQTSRGPDAELRKALTAFKNDLQESVRDLLRSKKAAEQLCRKGALENLELVQKYADWLREADLTPIEMEERREKAVSSLDQFVHRRRQKRRMRFMQALHNRADKQDLALEKLSDSPLTFHLEPLTVEADFDTGRVQLDYSRETVAETDLEPSAVFEARREFLDDLADRTDSAEAFFDRLHAAYRLAVQARDESEGDRVDLVDLLAPLALLTTDPDEWRRPNLEDVDGYPRHLLAYQIARLRHEGLLTHDGRRIDLGTATGGSTRDKENVLFIPSGGGEGQYYLSLRFTDERD
jgi:hypothetical protein